MEQLTEEEISKYRIGQKTAEKYVNEITRRGWHGGTAYGHSPVMVDITGDLAQFSRMDSGRNIGTHLCPTWSTIKGIFDAILLDKTIFWYPIAAIFINPPILESITHNNRCLGRKDGAENTQFESRYLLNPRFILMAEMRPRTRNVTRDTYGRTLRHFYKNVRESRPQKNEVFLGKQKLGAYINIPRPEMQPDESVNFTEYNVLRSIYEVGPNQRITYFPKLECIKGILRYPTREGQWLESKHQSHQRIDLPIKAPKTEETAQPENNQ